MGLRSRKAQRHSKMHFVVNSDFYGKINYKGPLICNLQFMNIINKKKRKKMCGTLYQNYVLYVLYDLVRITIF